MTNRTTRIGAEGSDRLASCHRSGTATGGTTGDGLEVPWVAGSMVSGIFCGGAHRKLVHIQAPPDHGTGLAQLDDTSRVKGRDIVLEHLGSAAQRLILNGERVFDADGNTIKRPKDLASRAALIRSLRLRECVVGVGREEGSHLAVDCCGAIDHCLSDGNRSRLTRSEHRGEFGNSFEMEIGHATKKTQVMCNLNHGWTPISTNIF